MATRILYENYLVEELLTGYVVSSEAVGFDKENIFTDKRRSKTWRSGVFFAIDATNNNLEFYDEVIGDVLIAYVPPGEYTTLASLAAALQTQMNIAGGANYTVEILMSGRIRISSDLSVGDEFRIGVDSTLKTTLGFINSDLTPDAGGVYEAANLPTYPSQYLRFDLGIASRPNALVMIGKRNEPVQISPTAIVTFQGNETDVWTSPSFSLVVPVNDRAILAFSPAEVGFHTGALRYWRILIADQSNVKNYVEVSTVFLGRYFEPSRGKVQIPWSSRYVDNSRTTYSENGNSFSDIRQQTDTFGMDWFGLTISEKEKMDYIFSKYGTGRPFFVALDPMAAMSSNQSYYLRYIKLSTEPSVRLESPGVFSIGMDCREEI